ncbi:MAG: RagB/SusD family nutrient uptake outer membrane protein [Mariniphaga sp.]|nr:RagB/SusD family nutrient uptake outer membrane protein [Mariniphaga sp.]
MKQKLIYIILMFSLFSCDDFITLQPEDTINEGMFFKTSDDYETALIGIYSGLQSIHGGSNLMYISELMSDNHTIWWTSPTTNEMECNEANITTTNGFVNSVWTVCYAGISRCNNILTRIDQANFSDALKSQYKGEALFLRAYFYFYLVRLFGDIPLIEVAFRSPAEIADFDMTRKPVQVIYQRIINDLKDADNLLKNVSGLSKSKASAGAVKALLGKVYLTQKEYAAASEVLSSVMGMNYALLTDYSKLFSVGNNQLAESIFEVNFLSGNIGEGNSYSTIFNPGIFNMDIFSGGMIGHGTIVPTRDFANAYEKNDLRRWAILDSIKLTDGTYQHDLGTRKFVDFTTGISGDGGVNFTALRYADVLLMKAEALNEIGFEADGEAFDLLNQVRSRAGLPDKTANNPVDSLKVANQIDFRLAIEKERRVEFVFEQQRWFDLIRTGRALTVVNNYFKNAGLNFTLEEYELLLPIPQAERDVTPELGQNTGY